MSTAVPWSDAWSITRQALSYTNHTLLPEALETWPVRMMEGALPRHLEIAYEINHRHLEVVREQFPADVRWPAACRWWSTPAKTGCAWPRCSSSASHRVNGVSALHSS